MATEEPSEEATHPVAKSKNPKMVGRGLLILIGATLLGGAVSAFYWVY